MESHRDADNGARDLRTLIAQLGTTGDELARTLGLDKHDPRRMESDDIQRRIGSMIEVLSKVEARFGSVIMAYAWYRSEALSGVRRQNIWHRSRRKLAECGPRLLLGFRRRAYGVASADVQWSVA